MLRSTWSKSFRGWFRDDNSMSPVRRRGVRRPSACAAEVCLLEPRTLLAAAFPEFVDPHPATGNDFGQTVLPLSTGNVVVTSPGDDAGGSNAGAVYLFNGSTGALISTLTGSHQGDQIGWTNGDTQGVFALTNGNFVVVSSFWDNGAANDAGAVTFGRGTTGVNGVVSASNSLVGTHSADQIGAYGDGVTALTNGNYVVNSPNWGNGVNAGVGAVTFGNGSTGITGAVSAANSLVGSADSDKVGLHGVTALTNGNYVVSSGSWDNGSLDFAGAVTWGNGTTGISGVVSAANSLVGTTAEDSVGFDGVTALSNGNYVVASSFWANGANADAGAVTWGNGSTGIVGAVSAANSLVGSSTGDRIGSGTNTGVGVQSLPNGNYVVASPNWANGLATQAGAVTFANGTTGLAGAITSANSLVGNAIQNWVGQDGITVLTNGNYVVRSLSWDDGFVSDVGAVTWGSGTTGVNGVVSAANSLVGSTFGDYVGNGRVYALTNGNYVVSSPGWTNGGASYAGAATFGNGTTGVKGVVSAANSLVGSTSFDSVGSDVTALTNGNYVVSSGNWDNGSVVDVGAVTWGNGTTGISGAVTTANSLVGSNSFDFVGIGGSTALTNGNYVALSPNWDNGAATNAGAVTFRNGSAATSGTVTAANSLVGSTANDNVGSLGNVKALTNGNYVVTSTQWDNGALADAGAVTWGNGTTGTSGAVSSANSLVGSAASDLVGYTPSTSVTAFPNGNYAVASSFWDNGALFEAGAVTFGDGTTGVTGAITATNSARGLTANTNLQSVVVDNVNGNFFGRFLGEGGGRVRVGSQTSGFANTVPVIGGAVSNQAVNDNATKAVFSTLTVTDPDTNPMSASVTILNGVVRGDFTLATTTGWTRTVSGNDIRYARTYPSAANIGATVQAAVRAFVFQPRQNAIKPNTTETTVFTVTVTDGIASPVSNNTTSVITTSVNNAPTFGGTSASVAVNDNATVNPFTALTVSDVDTQELLISVTILNGVVRGDFTPASTVGWATRYTTGNDITYKRYFSPQANVGAAAQAAFRALVFQPRQNAINPGTSEATDFQVTVSDGVAPAVLGTGTRVTTTSVNNAPTIGGVVTGQTMNDNQTKAVFSTLTITDPDTQAMNVIITIPNGVNRGDFTSGSTTGWTRTVVGVDLRYNRFFNAKANIGATVQTAIRALVFQPRTNVPIGTTETTGFTVFLNDGLANTTNSTTTVITTGVAPRVASSPSEVAALVLDSDIKTVIVPTVTKPKSDPLARLLKRGN